MRSINYGYYLIKSKQFGCSISCSRFFVVAVISVERFNGNVSVCCSTAYGSSVDAIGSACLTGSTSGMVYVVGKYVATTNTFGIIDAEYTIWTNCIFWRNLLLVHLPTKNNLLISNFSQDNHLVIDLQIHLFHIQ